eukprot:5599139-Pleurochrysis_carterae.AAC.1
MRDFNHEETRAETANGDYNFRVSDTIQYTVWAVRTPFYSQNYKTEMKLQASALENAELVNLAAKDA